MQREADLQELKQLKDLEDAVDNAYYFMVRKHKELSEDMRKHRFTNPKERPNTLFNIRKIEEKMSHLGQMKKMVTHMRGIRYGR